MHARILRATAVLPAMFTLLNGLAGFAAIHFAAKEELGTTLQRGQAGNLQAAAWLIFAAMLCDMLDGRVARMTRSTSDFGAQLDSLCDIISFGVAPALLVVRCSVSILRSQVEYLPIERIIWCIAAVFVACVALRLARFNVETEASESSHRDFRGLPSPGAAASIAATVLLFMHIRDARFSWLPDRSLWLGMSCTLPLLTLATAFLMVSRFRYPHIVNQYIRGRRPIQYLVKLLVVTLAAVINPFVTLAAAATLYVLLPPIRSSWRAWRTRHAGT